MAKISRVGHVVLYVSDVEAAVGFYRDALGMEVVRHDTERGMAFMSFGTQHHDIGLFRVKGEETRGTLGLAHIAMVIEGGMEELEELHGRLVSYGAEMGNLTDRGLTKSVYFRDPDGNRLEIYFDTLGCGDGARGRNRLRRNVHSQAKSYSSKRRHRWPFIHATTRLRGCSRPTRRGRRTSM